VKHSTQFFAVVSQRTREFFVDIIAPFANLNDGDAFEGGPSGDGIEFFAITFGVSSRALGDIEHDGCRRSSELRGQSKQLRVWKLFSRGINLVNEIQGLLVNREFFKIHHSVKCKPFRYDKATLFTSHSSLLTSHCWRSFQ